MSKPVEHDHEELESVLNESIRIAELIMQGRKVHESLELLTMVASLVLRTLTPPEDFIKILDIHYSAIKMSPTESPIKAKFSRDAD